MNNESDWNKQNRLDRDEAAATVPNGFRILKPNERIRATDALWDCYKKQWNKAVASEVGSRAEKKICVIRVT
jgi:hypothetical protein